MAGMIEEIFGVQPRAVRLAERAEQQKEIDANIAEQTSVLGKLGAGIGTGLGQGLTEGLRERLGIKTDAERIAESNKAEAQQLVQAMSQATNPADFEKIKLALIARGADPKYVTMFETMRKDALERQKPVIPEQVSKQDIDNASNLISSTLEELGFDSGDFVGNYDSDAYNVDVMQRVNQEKAKLLTSQKQGNQTPLPTDSQLVAYFVKKDALEGVVRNVKGFLDNETVYTPRAIEVTDYQDMRSGDIIEVKKKQ